MNSNHNVENTENFSDEIEVDDFDSVDDFIKQLEAREKDLHISSDLVIEVGESEFDDRDKPEIPMAEIISAAPPILKLPKVIEPAIKAADGEILTLKTRIAKMESERDEIYENSRRRQKDFDTYKSRTERERSETFTNQVSNLAVRMLPVLDNLDRALNFAEHTPAAKNQEFQQFFEGIMMVSQQLNEVLAGMGVSPIESVGHVFDPHYHEAVAAETSGEYAANTISAELLRGYRIGERVIRASMVKVVTTA